MRQTITDPEMIAQIIEAVVTGPETIDVPIDLVPADDAACTRDYAWCDGSECQDGGNEDLPEDAYHSGGVGHLSMLRFTSGGWQDLDDIALLIRHDEAEGADSRPLLMLDVHTPRSTPGMTAAQARQNAAWLLNAADLLDPLPTGAMVTTASKVRIGDELLTADGWQTVTGLLFDSSIEHASIYTPERDLDDDRDGWDFSFNDTVVIRRPVHGSCAIQFVEPLTGGTR